MIHELIYMVLKKFFIYLGRLLPNIKFKGVNNNEDKIPGLSTIQIRDFET